LVVSACGGQTNNNGENQQTAGDPQKLFNQKCSVCHGGNLQGGAGPNLQAVGSRYTKEEIEDIILNGKGNMRGGLYTGENASVLAQWLSEKK